MKNLYVIFVYILIRILSGISMCADRKYFFKVLGPINNHQLFFNKYDISYFYSLFDNAVVSTALYPLYP